MPAARQSATRKFSDPDRTLKGEPRAKVALERLETLWLNTGSLCNITCRNCYIESSPVNDRLVYLTAADAAPFLEEAKARGTREIGFTGGEPFMNPDIAALLEAALSREFEALVLTNAMQPMQRTRVQSDLLSIKNRYGRRLTLRVSLDHYTAALHETERGSGSWEKTLAGIDWLVANDFNVALAGRTCWGESEDDARGGYARLLSARGWPIDAASRQQLVLFPEMQIRETPEISVGCWDILGLRPSQMMCASSRMIVKRQGAEAPVVVPCTLLPYEPAFDMGSSLAAAERADGGLFDNGAVKLCHPYCSMFCVLGGGACS